MFNNHPEFEVDNNVWVFLDKETIVGTKIKAVIVRTTGSAKYVLDYFGYNHSYSASDLYISFAEAAKKLERFVTDGER